jgi:hypothetical protein
MTKPKGHKRDCWCPICRLSRAHRNYGHKKMKKVRYAEGAGGWDYLPIFNFRIKK